MGARFPLFIDLRRSLYRIAALSVMHGAAAGVFLYMPWLPPLRVAMLAVLALSLRRSLSPLGVVSLRLYENGGLECVLPDGTSLPAVPLPDTTVFSWLVALRLKAEGRKRIISLPLFPDHMSREEFRLLRLWLRWNRAATRESR
ncbi:MAG: hypothetical protein LBL48_02815, partial [Azoarcus sp.]|nr:hypothetical protein [Azoarcus sp.]